MKKSLPELRPGAALFLDRDGVINHRIPGGYVRSVDEFEPMEGAVEAVAFLSKIFTRVFVVTNQAGIGKGLMTAEDLAAVHLFLEKKVAAAGGRIDRFYHCPHLAAENCGCRKPATGMAERAKLDFPEIDFKNSWLAGDSASDIEMGKRLGMATAHIATKPEDFERIAALGADHRFGSLAGLVAFFGANG